MTVFDEHIGQYEAWFKKNDHVYQSELNAIKSLLPDQGLGLEIGVGAGLFAAPLGIAMGINPSPAMLEKASVRGIRAIRGVAESLPFKDGEFDFALMVTTVCFLDDIDLAFREAYRVLSPRGSFLIGFVEKDSLVGRMYEKKKGQSVFYKHATFYSVNDLLAHLAKAGFHTFQFRQTLFHALSEISAVEPVREGVRPGLICGDKSDEISPGVDRIRRSGRASRKGTSAGYALPT